MSSYYYDVPEELFLFTVVSGSIVVGTTAGITTFMNHRKTLHITTMQKLNKMGKATLTGVVSYSVTCFLAAGFLKYYQIKKKTS